MKAHTHRMCLFSFWRRLMYWPLVSMCYFFAFFVWEASLLAGDWLISPPILNFRQISMTNILSKVFERLELIRLGRFMESRGLLRTTQFAGKVLVLVKSLFVWLTPYRVHRRGEEARIVQIDCSIAFDTVNHQRILFKLATVGIEDPALAVLTQFLSNRSQYVVVVG